RQNWFINIIRPQWLALRSIPKTQRQIVEELKIKMRAIGYKDLEIIESLSVEQFLSIIRSLPSFSKIEKGVADKVQDVEYEVFKWFDICKKAFQDHYERRMKLWAFILSAIVVIGLNADILKIYKEFSVNKSLRDGMIESIPVLLNNAENKITHLSSGQNLSDIQRDSIIRSEIKFIESSLSDNSFQIYRWNTVTGDTISSNICSFKKGGFWCYLFAAFCTNWLGWLGMTLLVSLGAPFWYDFLKTLMGVKNSLRGGNSSGDKNKQSAKADNNNSRIEKEIPAVG
ncbi:MAG: hypothetical protein C0417_06360, partial [Chlorobiaceae bacterium]|nr:hypothetical protein [Chlorobiaceae bacterium]